MKTMMPASVISPTKIEIAAAMRRMMTSGFLKRARNSRTWFGRTREISFRPYSSCLRSASSVLRPFCDVLSFARSSSCVRV